MRSRIILLIQYISRLDRNNDSHPIAGKNNTILKDNTDIKCNQNNKPKPRTIFVDSSHAIMNEFLEEVYDKGDLLYSTNGTYFIEKIQNGLNVLLI